MKTVLLYVFVLFSSLNGFTQTFDEFVKSKQTDFEKHQHEFNKYYQQKDEEFQKYLAEKWAEFDVFAGVKAYQEPKPHIIPEYKPQPKRKPVEIIPKLPKKQAEPIQTNPDTDIKPSKYPNKPEEKIPTEDFPSNTNTETPNSIPVFQFFGENIYAETNSFLCPVSPKEFSGLAFSNWWNKASKNNYKQLIEQLLTNKTRLNLNDWGYFKLIEKTSATLTNSSNQKKLLQWFLLVKSGYDVRIAFNKNELSLFVPVKQQLYSMSFIEIDGINYYVFSDFTSKNVKTYKRANQNAKTILDFNLKQPMILGLSNKPRGNAFVYKLKNYYFKLNYNPNWTSFFSDYPQGDLEIYFDAAVSNEFNYSVEQELKPAVQNMKPEQAVNFLLRYVQEGFKYETDQEQFGYEKFFFPEETLHYPYADCEDRSVYFAWLIRKLLGLDVIGLKYPGHIATAVNIPGQVKGDFIMFDGKKYTMADPTYIGAPAGLTMTSFANVKPEVINLK